MGKNRNRIGARMRQVRAGNLTDLQRLFAPWVDEGRLGASSRRRLFSLPRVFWAFLAQVLSPDGSCREALQKFLAWLELTEGQKASPNTAAYCKARARLPKAGLLRVHRNVVRTVLGGPLAQERWRGRCVKVVDGSGLSMPDTPANQQRYPQSKKTKPGCGFPEMRIVALFSLATGVLVRCVYGSRYQSERSLFRQLWTALQPGDVVLADRGFCGYAEFFSLSQRGIDSVMRLHGRRSTGVRLIKRLGPGDELVHWLKIKPAVSGFSKQQWARIPSTLTVRHIAFTVDIAGFRTQRIVIATTLTNPRQFPLAAFKDLYRHRWNAELYFKHIKIALGMDILRCQTPGMVEKELLMHLIAYNLIRATMLKAAHAAQCNIERISFKGTCQTIRQWAPILALATGERAGSLHAAMLQAIARAPVPYRPDRVEPRAKKRRPKNYQLLNLPRHLFKECPHRNRYVKTYSA